jgi:SAM-dependent methyltransferase
MNTITAPPVLEHLSVLGDETRTRILALLERGEFTVSELCTVLQSAQPTVSRHLKTLASEGWVSARADGRNRHYRLTPSLDEAARGLWQIVREEIATHSVYGEDAERARSILDDRRLRSSAFFAETAEYWEDKRNELFGSATGLAPLLGLIDPSWTVGDLGTGSGALCARLAPFARHVVGVDRSEEMLSAAATRLEGVTNVELRCGDLEALPVEDATFDLAILALVLHYVVDPLRVLSEARRALTADGTLLLLDMRPHDRGAAYAEDMGHVWPGFDVDQMEGWLTTAGYSKVRIAPLPPDPNAAGPLLFLASARP